MAVPLTIQGVTYNYPESGEDPNWGSDASDWAVAMTAAINSFLSTGDILLSTATIANNQSANADVSGLLFDPSIVRAANISYAIYRVSTATPSGNAESGTIYITYDSNASVGSKWNLTQQINGSSGVTFNITDLGQVQYKSSDINAVGYSGTIKFSAKTLPT